MTVNRLEAHPIINKESVDSDGGEVVKSDIHIEKSDGVVIIKDQDQ